MFVRSKIVKQNGRTYEYVQIVENSRDEQGITRQRVLKSLGNRDDLDPKEIDRLMASLATAGAT